MSIRLVDRNPQRAHRFSAAELEALTKDHVETWRVRRAEARAAYEANMAAWRAAGARRQRIIGTAYELFVCALFVGMVQGVHPQGSPIVGLVCLAVFAVSLGAFLVKFVREPRRG